MLNAFRYGKKRGTGAEGENLAKTFGGAEDTLTATFFERLLYLPDAVVAKVLLEPFGDIDGDPRIKAFQFWPRWERPDLEGFKEPDLVIEWDSPEIVLVIEAKRWDFAGQQNPNQLADEWLAARGRRPSCPIWLLAVGGIPDTRTQTTRELELKAIANINDTASSVRGFRFSAMMWFELFLGLENALGKDTKPHAKRIVDDIREGMAMHGVGVVKPLWLGDLVESAWAGVLDIREESVRFLEQPSQLNGPCNLLDLAALGPILSGTDDLARALGGRP